MKITGKAIFLLVATISIVAIMSISARSQPSAQMVTANKIFEAGRWSEAARAYEEITKAEPANARAWFQLGKARMLLKQYKLAISAFGKNLEVTKNPIAMLKTACAYARLDQKDIALKWLEDSSKNGIASTANLDREVDLDSLRDDPRFKEINLRVEKEQKPCLFLAEAKQFDFWLGTWDVYNPQGQKAGVSHIEKISGGCGLLENWTNSIELPGKSINFYDPFTKRWYQYWIGTDGIPIRFQGSYSDNAMRFLGESITPDGKKTINRLTFFNIDPNTVRQLGEDSVDDGKTWTVSYDLKYVRRSVGI